MAIGLKEKKIDKDRERAYIYHLTARYIKPINKVRIEMIK